jgi:hypothetical protein
VALVALRASRAAGMIVRAAVPERRASEEVQQQDRLVPSATAEQPSLADCVDAARRGRLGPAGAIALQRVIGNAAVGRILARQPGAATPADLMDPSDDAERKLDESWDQMMADLARLGEKVGKEMIDTINSRDWVLFNSRLNALSKTERLALEQDADFWRQLRGFLSGYAYWSVQLRLRYGEGRPPEVSELSTAIFAGDWRRTRTLLMGYDSLKAVPGLREVSPPSSPPRKPTTCARSWSRLRLAPSPGRATTTRPTTRAAYSSPSPATATTSSCA